MTNAGAVSGLTANGTYNFIYSVTLGGQTCTDTVQVTRNAKPTVNDPTICAPATTVTLTFSPAGGTFAPQSGNPAAATITAQGVVSGLTANGTYNFIYTLNGCADTASVTRNAKPDAGVDSVGAAAICNTVATIDLPDAMAGESWAQLGSTPKAVTIDDSTGVVTGLDAVGTYQFILSNAATGCADTVSVEVQDCANGTVGDLVWKDLNDNGQLDLGEPGVAGVVVQLLNGTTDAVITSDTTDVNGIYTFTGLAKGAYKVKIDLTTLPDSCLISTMLDAVAAGDSLDNDFDSTGVSPVVNLDPILGGIDKDNPTIDAALYSPKGSIGDFVWKDLNDDGQQDSGEPGVNLVKVTLHRATGGLPGPAIDSTLTSGTGSNAGAYSFTNLPKGDYIVKIDLTTLPDSCLISTKLNSVAAGDSLDNDFDSTGLSPVVSIDPTVPGLSKNNPTIDAALYSPKGSIGDFVWKDLNDNGQQDSGEPGVNGVKVTLHRSIGGLPGPAIDSTLTSGTGPNAGAYSFTNLLKDDYIVKIDLTTLPDSCQISTMTNAAGVPDSLDSDFGPDGLSQVVSIDPAVPGLGKDNPTIDAALYTPKGSIGDFVWKDLDDDGQQDPGEPGVNGVKVTLHNFVGGVPGPAIDSTTTSGTGANAGAYSFTDLSKGDYIVKIDLTTLPDSCLISTKPNAAGVLDSLDSDFDSTGLSQVVSIDPALPGLNKNNPTIDAALYSPKGSIGDFVWKDLNDDGQQDSGEPGVPGVVVQLLDATTNALIATDTTDAGGKYGFDNLAKGTYTVQIDLTTLPDSCLISTKPNAAGVADSLDSDFNAGGLSQVVSIDPVLGGIDQNNPTIDAALYSPKASIGDFVWKDLDDDGQQDAGEPGVPGVVVQLLNASDNTVLASDTTDANGMYNFTDLSKGDYLVKIDLTTLPDSCLISTMLNSVAAGDSLDNDFDSTGLSSVVSIDPTVPGLSKNNPTIDAALFTPKGSIGDFVWKDLNDNGQQDSGEPGVPGVLVRLLDGSTNAILATDTTDANGNYLFDNLLKGSYTVQIDLTTLPDSCLISTKMDAAADSLDNDFGPTGLSGMVDIDPAIPGLTKNNPTIDAALYSPKGSIGDFVWKDLNDDGQQDPDEPGVNGVKLTLHKATGGLPGPAIDSTTTSGTGANAGAYNFTNLSKGDYIVKIDKTTIPDTCALSRKPNAAGVPDSLDSDFDSTGLSQVVSIDPAQPGLSQDNPTIDAALRTVPKGTITDPCTCFKVEYAVDENKKLSETIEVKAGTGQTWQVVAQTGASVLDSTDKQPLPLGTMLVEGPPGLYKLTFTHDDEVGYSIKVSNGTDTLTMSNLCTGSYPEITLTTLDSTICQNADPVPLTAFSTPEADFYQYFYKDKVTGERVNITELDPAQFAAGDTVFVKLEIGPTNPQSCPTIIVQPVVIKTEGCEQPVGSIGDYVFKDKNDNGLQDAGDEPVTGVKLNLYAASGGTKTGPVLASDTTDAAGKYLFDSLSAGDYIVEIDQSTLPDSCLISSNKDVNGNGSDATDSDFDPTSGLSQVVTLAPKVLDGNSSPADSLATNNLTVDAALISPKGSIGNFVFKDQNDNGQKDSGEPGVDGVKIILYAANASGQPGAILDSTRTTNGGIYNFANLPKGDYLVQIDLTTLPDSCALSAKPNAQNVPDSLDSDFDETGFSPVVKLDPVKGGIDQNNPTIGAGLVTALGSIGDFVWKDNNDNGQQDGSEPGVPGVILQLLKAADNTVLASDTTDASGKYGFANLPRGDYKVKVLLTSLPDSCLLSAKPNAAGVPDSLDSDFDAAGVSQLVSLDPAKTGLDKDNPTIDAALVKLPPAAVYDLALEKSVDKKLAMLGDTVTYTIEVVNQGGAAAHGIEVADSLTAGVQYLGSTASIGSYSPGTKLWKFDSVAVGGVATLTIRVKVTAPGVWFNTAQITKMDEQDQDSTPGNNAEGEDDIDRECFTVPILLCKGDGKAVALTVPAQYTGVEWFRKEQGGQPVKVADGNTYEATETELGSYEYTYTSTSGSCPAEGCCPIIIVVEDCCPAEICVPVTVKKVKVN